MIEAQAHRSGVHAILPPIDQAIDLLATLRRTDHKFDPAYRRPVARALEPVPMDRNERSDGDIELIKALK